MAIRITFNPGKHARADVPMAVTLPPGSPDGAWRFQPGNVTGQSADGVLYLVVPKMKSKKKLALTGDPAPAADPGVSMTCGEGTIEFKDGGNLITRYHFGEASELPIPARPYFYPVILNGLELTRHVAAKGEPPRKIDHPHHRSLWVAHGAVNGTDDWMEEPGHGFQRHVSFGKLVAGPVVAGFQEDLVWESAERAKLLEERRNFRIWKSTKGDRFFDLDVTFKAAYGDVVLGDTKEGGICAIRVREDLQGDRKGLLTNAHGGTTEAEVWGYRSPWIDNSGKLEGRKVGIAIFDHPKSFRHPTHWHARDYGLIGANPFAWNDYKTGWSQDGSHTIRSGETLSFKYRLYLHEGGCRIAKVADKWLDFGHPPKTEVATI